MTDSKNKSDKPQDKIYVGLDAIKRLNDCLNHIRYKMVKFFILADENTVKHCLPFLINQVPRLNKAEVIEIESGNRNKNIQICIELWKTLGKYGANRQSVLLNLGGGVICDLGGFAASTFKRGIEFINVPTTLLAQADASLGGKVGIDLDHIKNEVGLFRNPSCLFIYPGFLKTLNKREFMSGYAEMIKHALIQDKTYWSKIVQLKLSDEKAILELIICSVKIKEAIVLKDPYEKEFRKILNFGHTIGHAIESYFLEKEEITLLHGEAIAVGIICESYISHFKNKLRKSDLNEITSFILSLYQEVPFKEEEDIRLIELMKNDKKNKGNDINFTLLNKIGSAEVNKKCSVELIRESFSYYHEQYELKNSKTLKG